MPVTIGGSGPITGVTSINTTVSDTELGYLDGVTSALQTQINAKAAVSQLKILQVVNATYGTQLTRAGSLSWADTGLTATITPSSASSKVLVIVHQTGLYKTAADIVTLVQLVRNGSSICLFEASAGGTASTAANYVGGSGTTYLDSPATTSAITYKTQYSANVAVGTIGVQMINSVSTMTLMEVAS